MLVKSGFLQKKKDFNLHHTPMLGMAYVHQTNVHMCTSSTWWYTACIYMCGGILLAEIAARVTKFFPMINKCDKRFAHDTSPLP